MRERYTSLRHFRVIAILDRAFFLTRLFSDKVDLIGLIVLNLSYRNQENTFHTLADDLFNLRERSN